MATFYQREGELNIEERRHFNAERDVMIGRVVRDMDAVFTTCANSGNDISADSFQPDVLCVDEGGQVTMPSFCVPLTSYREWKGLLLFADIRQLRPTVLSSGLNEFIRNVRLSPLALLVAKGFPYSRLDMQYRSDPEITNFPARQFYPPGELRNHPCTFKDNETKVKVRNVSVKHYGIKEKDGGNVYWFADVQWGVARVEPNGTSQQNHGNADAVVECVRHLLEEGIQAENIAILTLYKGQISVLLTKLREMVDEAGAENWAVEMIRILPNTVDSYQGKESDVVIVDTVCATNEYENLNKAANNVSAHVKDPHRLNVALKRARYGCIVFGQAALLLAAMKYKNKHQSAIGYLVQDAQERGLFAQDDSHFDSHPDGVRRRAELKKEEYEAELRRNETARFNFMKKRTPNAFSSAGERALEKAPRSVIYHTAEGPTTQLVNPDPNALFDQLFPLDEEDDDDWGGAATAEAAGEGKGNEAQDIKMEDAEETAGPSGGKGKARDDSAAGTEGGRQAKTPKNKGKGQDFRHGSQQDRKNGGGGSCGSRGSQGAGQPVA